MTTDSHASNPAHVIRPLIGFGSIRFGMTMADVAQILGEPRSRETVTHDDSTQTTYWKYDDPQLEIGFDDDLDDRLARIGVRDPRATLRGRTLIGTEQGLCLILIESDGIRISDGDEMDDLGLADFYCDDESLSFWFEEGELTLIDMFPRYDEAGEFPIWPGRGES